MKIVILGLGTAGFAAILAVKKTNPSAEIVVIDGKDFDLLHNCGIPYVLSQKFESMEELKHELNLEAMNVKRIRSDAVMVDKNEKIVLLGNEQQVKYDKLIIATGAKAFIPPIDGNENAYLIDNNIANAEKFHDAVKKAKSAVIIGAGAIGIETAVALAENGLSVSVIEMMDRILPAMLDSDMAQIMQEKLQEKGIKFYMKSKTVKIERKSVLLESGESVKGDAVLLSAGAKANTAFLKNAGIAVDKGILVNEKMETNNPDIYAAGDCCQTKSIITKTPMNALLAVPAYKQGTVAGVNSAGGSARYKGALATCVVKMSDIEASATGFTKSYAEFLDIPAETGKIKGTDTASWYPNAKELVLKIIVDKNSERVIGAQAVGSRAADKINVIATAIKAGMTAEDISQLELAYCPSVSDAYDIITAAAEIVLRKLKR